MNTKGVATAPGGKRNRDGRETSPVATGRSPIRLFGWFLLFLLGALLWMFYPALDPDKVQFSNDAPLGVYTSQWLQVPSGFHGLWHDLNSIGTNQGTCPVIFSHFFRWAVGAVWYSKIYPPVTILFLGACAWLFFRSLKLSPLACALGGLAVALNSGFFSAACWGIGTQEIAIGFDFLALAAVASGAAGKRWIKLVLAGFAVGMGIMEGVDVGALFSMLVAAFVMVQALVEGVSVRNFIKGAARTAVVALCAAFIAMNALSSLISTQIQGVAGTGQDVQSRAERWDWATTWSFPKRETLSLFMPGVFGYRMDTPDGGNYWGAMGRDPSYDRYFASDRKGPLPQGSMRFNGGGQYNGVLVVLIALWAAIQSFRRTNSAFALDQRKYIWFWTAVGGIALLLSYGRFAPFYRLVYALPYFSTIRNPSKFIMFFNFATMVLFAYGVHGLAARYLSGTFSSALDLRSRVKNWWSKAPVFDRRWVAACVMAIVVSLVGWMIFATARSSFEQYLQTVEFEPSLAHIMAGFSLREVGWFVLFLVASVIVLILIFSGTFAGKRAKWAGVLLGLILVVDLVRANEPWVKYVDFKEKNASNALIDILREKPYEHRVVMMPIRMQRQFASMGNLYRIEWAQHQFQYYNIQSLDVVQMPRTPLDLAAYQAASAMGPMTRRWELSNTRYLLGPAVWIDESDPSPQPRAFPFIDIANQEIDQGRHRFQTVGTFNLVQRPGARDDVGSPLEQVTVEAGSPRNGYSIALYDFSGALPRAKLYSNWKVSKVEDPATLHQWVTNAQARVPGEWGNALAALGPGDQSTLKELFSPGFDPAQVVLLQKPLPQPAASGATNQDAGTVEFLSYAPKDVKLKAVARTPAVLMLNDKFDPNWRVQVDGKPAELLVCNFLMRGVSLTPGEHTVEFLFATDPGPMYVSLAGIAIGFLLIGYLTVSYAKPK